MRIEKAREMGFCFGVRRAIRLMEQAAHRCRYLESLGPVVHNHQVMERLEGLGVRVVVGPEAVTAGVVAIPSHGAPPEVIAELERRGIEVVDTTCPMVRRAQQAAQQLTAAGFQVVIFGDAQHPEVKGVLGWAGERAVAVSDGASLLLPKFPKRLGLLSQTTQSPERFSRFMAGLLPQALDQAAEVRLVNTICHATRQHQAAALELARHSQLVLVVGSLASANTRHLAQLCSAVVETRQVEAAEDIEPGWLAGKEQIGITAGASTPEEVVAAVVTRLESIAEGGG